MSTTVPETISAKIMVIRNQRVLMDSDLARIYGVSTKRLNEQVRRNSGRFPQDFAFRLTPDDLANLKSHFATSSWGGKRKLPLVFTEHGSIMAATVLNSRRAMTMTIFVVRAFIALRQMTMDYQALYKKVVNMEHKYDTQFSGVFAAIKQLMTPVEHKKRKIGFAPHTQDQ
ncbi:MAG TPA: ORF6N domain-containing protein [Candidatus Edwardsbacteria bacterium]|nr:ORF6N domain-containing protein [Candidatus Edwardsbacteria bacterium]